jgi:hypothetical protein
MTCFRVIALPASEGDCLVISYGSNGPEHHIVIDGGRKSAAGHLRSYLDEQGIDRLELLVVSHVDADHIEGILEFLEEASDTQIDDIWFNGYRHLSPCLSAMGPVQGERLTALLAARRWNVALDGASICLPASGVPRSMPPLAGGMQLTLLSPSIGKLVAMQDVWEAECAKAGLTPGVDAVEEPVPPGLQPQGPSDLESLADMVTPLDKAPANGSSIAFLAEFGGKRALFGADAHADVLIAALDAMTPAGPVDLDLLKVAHHGSHANTSRALLERLNCSNFLVSTSGARFKHPDPAAIARLVLAGGETPMLHFNYDQPRTRFWHTRARQTGEPDYQCLFPDAIGRLTIELC